MFDVELDRLRQDFALQVAPLHRQVLDAVLVGDLDGLLLDDRPVVEVLGDEMRRGADDLHPPRVGLVIGLGPGEGGKERVVDVDDPPRVAGDERRAQDPHVARQDHEIDPLALEHFQQLALLFGRVRAHREEMERHAEHRGHVPQVLVVAEHGREVDVDLPRAPAQQQVEEAMVLPGDQDRHAQPLGGEEELVGDAELSRQARQSAGEGGPVEGEALQLPLDPHEELVLGGAVLVEPDDVPAVVEDEAREARDQPLAVRALNQQYRVLVHLHQTLAPANAFLNRCSQLRRGE